MRPVNIVAKRASHARKDPAPSRTRYRLQRIWMTPLYRKLITKGLPVLALGSVVALFAMDEDVQARFNKSVDHARASVRDRPEFQLQLLRISGASTEISDMVRKSAAVSFPVSSFDVDIVEIQRRIEALDAVEKASVFARTGGVLDVEITERIAVAVWRSDDVIEEIDAKAVRVKTLTDRWQARDLPLIVGEGAKENLPEALELIATATPISMQLRGLIRIGERRWDMVLDRGVVINLPEDNPNEALLRVLALHRAQNLFGKDITVVDFRDGQRPILRLSENPDDDLTTVSDQF